MSGHATKTTTTEKRASQYKRKPVPTPTLLDLELGSSPSDRYPPFDLDDPFASLTELRRRSRSCSWALHSATDLHHSSVDTAPFDLPPFSQKAFPSDNQRRYTLTVALPGPLASPATTDASPLDAREADSKRFAEREDALARLTKTRSTSVGSSDVDKDAVSNRSGDASSGRASHQDHHRRYTHISMLFRAASSAHLPQNGRGHQATRSHYIPRKASSLSYMYTPPLTPDVSGASSSSSSLFDPAMMPTPEDKDALPPRTKSPTPSAHSFVKKLLTKRSTSALPPVPRRKQSLDAKDLPSLPPSPTSGANREPDNAPTIPFPRLPLASMSDVTLAATTGYSEKPKTTKSIIGASPQPAAVLSRLSPSEREGDGYVIAPGTRLPPGAELDAGLTPPKKIKLFSFSSRSLLRSKVDLYESVDETGRKINLPETPKEEFDEFAFPTPKQLLTASSLPVVSESGVRVRFGDVWEKQKTVVIFIRHFRASACQDYVRSIASEVDVEALEMAGLKIVIIGMGSPSLITPYRQLTGATFPIYTDPTLAVYHALGLNLRSTDRGSSSERGHYVVQRGGAFGTLRRTLAGATRLPLFERAGDATQLGGEFVLGPGLGASVGGAECFYAHRMRTTRAHTPILDVVAASGVQTARTRRVWGMRIRIGGDGADGMMDGHARRESMDDEDAWMAKRRRSLVRLRKKRQRRRVGTVHKTVSDDAAKNGQGQQSDTERRGRFSVVEEDDEDADESFDA